MISIMDISSPLITNQKPIIKIISYKKYFDMQNIFVCNFKPLPKSGRGTDIVPQ